MKKIIAEVSARHLHLCQKDLEILFGSPRGEAGKKYLLHQKSALSQTGHYAAQETVNLVNKSKSLTVRIIGPTRPDTQVELSMTDCKFLDIKPILRLSGDLKNSSGLTLVGPKGKLKLKTGVIVAKRHLHLAIQDAKKWQLKNNQKVSVQVKGERALVFKNIIVRVGEGQTRLHLDTDEANAAGIKNGEIVYLDF